MCDLQVMCVERMSALYTTRYDSIPGFQQRVRTGPTVVCLSTSVLLHMLTKHFACPAACGCRLATTAKVSRRSKVCKGLLTVFPRADCLGQNEGSKMMAKMFTIVCLQSLQASCKQIAASLPGFFSLVLGLCEEAHRHPQLFNLPFPTHDLLQGYRTTAS